MNEPKRRWWLPDLIDLHIYGGVALVGWGLGTWAAWAGLTAAGFLLLILGIKRG